jgi:hypothetical protein
VARFRDAADTDALRRLALRFSTAWHSDTSRLDAVVHPSGALRDAVASRRAAQKRNKGGKAFCDASHGFFFFFLFLFFFLLL